MNERIIKESRALLPMFAVMLLGTVAPLTFVDREAAAGGSQAVFIVLGLLLAASCFGNEFQLRTMPMLLAQPVSRRKIWNEKMLVMGAALLLGTVVCLICAGRDEDSITFVIGAVCCIYFTAPFATFSVKNTLTAAAVTFAIPFTTAMCLAGGIALVEHYYPGAFYWVGDLGRNQTWMGWMFRNHGEVILTIPLAIYCGVMYRLGHRAFIKLQAIDAQAQQIALPAGVESFLGRRLQVLLPKYSGQWASLVRKEIHLQKAGFLVAGTGILFWLAGGLGWNVYHSDVLMGMAVAPIAILVFVIPLITAGVCVAEERSLGVSIWHRALPVPPRKQWAAKMWVVFWTCALLGVALPAALWAMGGWVFRLPYGPPAMHHAGMPSLPDTIFLITDFLGYLLIVSLGIYASSACVSAVKAILLHIGLLALLAWTAVEGASTFVRISSGDSLSPDVRAFFGGLVAVASPWGLLCIILMLGLVQYLAYWNFRKGGPGAWRICKQVALILASALVLLVFVWACVAVMVMQQRFGQEGYILKIPVGTKFR